MRHGGKWKSNKGYCCFNHNIGLPDRNGKIQA
jgi:hypothetical protein